jgi:hypothetical protein
VAQFDRTIPPGGEGKITLQVKTKGYDGIISKSARVLSNDLQNPQTSITIKGKVWTPLRVKPRYVHINGIVGEKVESAVELRGEKKEPLIVELDSVSIPDKVSAELIEIEKGRAYTLKVENKVQEAQKYRGEVKLTTNYPEKPDLTVRISGNIRALLEVRPKVLTFGKMSEERLRQLESTNKSMTRPVVVVLNKGNDLQVEKVELAQSLFKVVKQEQWRGRRVQFMIEPVLEKLKKGPNTDVLKVYTNQGDKQVLEVPVQFELL